ncbi:MAG: DUF4328 domain-containing protein [Acidimicrobiia bacterium]|nr:DUF4328 domain-containing protein [Acidimicrobiia bacterium]
MDQTPVDTFLDRAPSEEPPHLRWAERPSRVGSLAIRHRQGLGVSLRFFLGMYVPLAVVAGGLALSESFQDWQLQSYWQGSEVTWPVLGWFGLFVLVLGGYTGTAALMLWTYGTVAVVRNWTPTRLSPRLAAWGWLIPFVNFVVPVRTVRLMARGSAPGPSGSLLRLGAWWRLSWAALLATSVVGGLLPLSNSSPQAQHEVFMRSMSAIAGFAALWAAIGFFFVGRVNLSLAPKQD